MRYYRTERDDRTALLCEHDDEFHDLTAVKPGATSFADLAAAAEIADATADEVADRLVDDAPAVSFDESDARRPFVPDEVWAAGVTYAISQKNREGEGSVGETYLDAYESERPEVYFKATPTRTVGPGEAVGIRADSEWDVPEPELTIVLNEGEIVGYTVGNDVCSREIERDNLLYLPQSKIYRDSCSIGPCVATPDAVGDPHDLEMSMTIERDGTSVFEGSTSTSEMVRTCEELTGYFRRCNYVPETTALLTGTSIIPPNDVSLEPDDTVAITIEDIGVLENTVVEVA